MSCVVIAYPHVTYPGGATAVALETGQRLADRGHEVHLVSIRHERQLTERFPSIRFHDLGGPLPNEFSYWSSLRGLHGRFHEVVDDLAADVVLAHVFPANYWAFVYRAARKIVRCVWYCHEPSAFVHDLRVIRGLPWPMQGAALAANPMLQFVDRRLARSADVIVANSSYTAERIEHIYGRFASVAPPGVDVARFQPAGEKEPLVLSVGRLTNFKRFDIVLRAAAVLRQAGFPARWVILGDGEDQVALHSLARRLSVTDCVEFIGRVDERTLTDYFKRAAIVAVTSINEPFGIVPVEAMAAGAAVICSDSGGPARTIRDGMTGLHFRSGDPADFARKVAQLLQHPQQAREMGARGRQIALSEFTWEGTTAGIDQAIALALSGPHPDPTGTAPQ